MFYTRNRSVLLILVVLALLLAAVLFAVGAALADGPVIWKMHCPDHHDVVQIPANDWGGVHVMCIRAADREEVTPDNND